MQFFYCHSLLATPADNIDEEENKSADSFERKIERKISRSCGKIRESKKGENSIVVVARRRPAPVVFTSLRISDDVDSTQTTHVS
jgi:hypothetical protein